ncbi:hypothetical protein L1887_37116 [Cichorium endivia]|nr:hypothetical protein L1887_37116 [Cichorium endivia]
MITLGTQGGTVHIIDFLGNQPIRYNVVVNSISLDHVKEFWAHTAAFNDLCFDLDGDFIGSCSDDGAVVIISLHDR